MVSRPQDSPACNGKLDNPPEIYKSSPAIDAVLHGTLDVTRGRINRQTGLSVRDPKADLVVGTVSGASQDLDAFGLAVAARAADFVNGLVNPDTTLNVEVLSTKLPDTSAYVSLAEKAQREGNNVDLAAALLSRAFDNDSRNARLPYLLRKARYSQQRYQEAMSYLKISLEVTPDDPEVLEELGDVYSNLNQLLQDFRIIRRDFQGNLQITHCFLI